MSKSLKCALALGISSIALATSATIVNAATENTEASVEIVSPISITENNAMDFGFFAAPTSNQNVITLGTDDSRTKTGTGDGAFVAGGSIQAADYDISASSGATINLSVNNINASVGGTGLTLNGFTGSYNGGADGDLDAGYSVASAGNSINLKVGADMTVQTTASGSNTFTYDLNVDYQ